MATMLVSHARSACCTSHSYRVAWLRDRPFLGQLEEFAPAASARSDPFWFVLQDHPTGPHSSALYKAMAANHTSSLCFVHSIAQHPKGKGSHTASGANLLLCWCDVVSGCRVTPAMWLAKAGACQHHLAHCFATCTLLWSAFNPMAPACNQPRDQVLEAMWDLHGVFSEHLCTATAIVLADPPAPLYVCTTNQFLVLVHCSGDAHRSCHNTHPHTLGLGGC